MVCCSCLCARAVRPRLVGKEKTPLSSRLATGMSWSPLSDQKGSHPYMTTGKTIALTRRTFVGKVMSLLLNMRGPASQLIVVPYWWSDPTFIPKSGLAVLPGSGCHFPCMFPHPDSAVKDQAAFRNRALSPLPPGILTLHVPQPLKLFAAGSQHKP